MNNKYLFLSLLVFSCLTSSTDAQQNYSGDAALECGTSDETGPSPAFLYTCNGQRRSCPSFLIFKAQPSLDSVPAISALTSANQNELASINNVTMFSDFRTNQEVIVPVNCFCLGKYYQANTSFQVTSSLGTYYSIANDTYEGLSTCASLVRENPFDEYDLPLGAELRVPLRCACPTTNQAEAGIKYLLTYPFGWDDDVSDTAKRFNVSRESILEANGLADDSDISPDTTILIPLPIQPENSQTIVHSNPPETSLPADISPQSVPIPGRRISKRRFVVGLAAACTLLVLGVILAIGSLLYRKRRGKIPESGCEMKLVLPEGLRIQIASCEQVLKVYAVEEIKKATENFSSKLRIKGAVYRGEFGEEILAVKKVNGDVSKEVNILKKINHFNLIRLQGVCENQGCFYLVFEYMKNGSLREWLSGERCGDIGSWSKRIQIALDVANGLQYLHSFAEPAYVHQDVNSTNILLTSDLRAKIANFSLARAASREPTDAALTKHVGTRGYMAPEYLKAGRLTPKIDVYAFGVILLELITGIDAVFVQDGREVLLSTAVISVMEKQNAEAELDFLVDPSLDRRRHGAEFSERLAKVSVACLTQEPIRRPSMEEVVSTLLKIQADLQRSESFNVDSVDVAVPSWILHP